MAQIETGLGWSAKDNWLVSLPGEIAKIEIIGGSAYPGQPIPKNLQVFNDIVAAGFRILDYTQQYFGSIWYVASPDSSDILVAGTPITAGSGNYRNYHFWFISPTSCTVYIAQKGTGSYGRDELSQVAITTQDSQTGLYFAELGGSANPISPPDNNIHVYCPTFANTRTALDAVVVGNTPFSKVNAGYAVASLAKWKTSNNTLITTPVLISSVSEYTDMTTTASGYTLAKLNILHAGMRFYMSFWDITDAPGVTSQFPEFDYSDPSDPSLTLENVFKFIASVDYAAIGVSNAPDPYEEEGAGSGEEGGDGEDLEDDEMGISHHAIPAAINTGFCRIYCPSEQQLRDLSNFLWSAQFDITAVKKLFANPMDSVLGLSAVPLTLSGANAPVYLGGVDTEMSFPMVSYQSYQAPMGAITVEKRWGSYLDYDPYTRFSIFLPFIGFKDLSADDIMGKQIILDYDVDILSGACTARLQAGGNVLYQWSGQCSIQLPVTASNWNQVFQGATSAALSAGLAVATGSAGPVLAGALAAEGAQAIMGKPRIERGGTASGAAGWMGGLTPYLVRVTPEAIIPSDQNKFIGYPAFSSISLGDLSGYNEISSIHLEGIPATGAELEELEAILKGGVIF